MVLRTFENATEGRNYNSAMPSQPPQYEQGRALQSDVAALHLDPPNRVPTPDLSDHEDDDSDWDASEREDEPGPRRKSKARPANNSQSITYAPPPGPPPPPPKPAPLDVTFNNAIRPEDELIKSPWADHEAPQSTSASKSTNNPFRRPTDYTPSEYSSRHTSVWNALETNHRPPNPEPPQPPQPTHSPSPRLSPTLPSSSSAQPALHHHASSGLGENLIDLDPPNPWGEDATKKDSGIAAPNVESSNPWDDSSRKPLAPPSASLDQSTAEARTGIDQLTLDDAHSDPSNSAKESSSKAPAAANLAEQRNEIYPVKRIRWYDVRSKKKPRESPILIQNANGPCPLLALVNALSLSTPPELQTELIRTLSSREQISLGLLIDAVFEELMSGRRGSTAQELPDISQLYSFLVTLHTGMNVNPQFVGPSSTGLGSFEPTTEMTLYSTFAVPLIHGWVPRESDNAYAAFDRSAPTYEEAQNVLFREDEIEQKLGTSNVTQEEQNILLDLGEIKHFFSQWPTQLTQHGLESMGTTLEPGSVSILFRNDHFSTLYKEPKTGQLMTLVTDAGYASHDEIIWESLVDISGTSAEMFSGDFRCVSHNASASGRDGGQWETVQAKSAQKQASKTPASQSKSASSAAKPAHNRAHSEQEDRDLALALQLQEEEDQRHRSQRAAAARRREDQLSQQYISGDTPEQRPQVPPRRNNRPATHREEDGDPELPTYEQAAATRPYRPPQGHPASEYPPRPGGQQYQQYSGQQRVTGRPSAGATPFDNSRRGNRTEYDAIQERREGCTVM